MTTGVRHLRLVKLGGGERYPVLVGHQGVPLWFPSLFATTQLRNSGKTTNTIVHVLSSVRLLLGWAQHHNLCLEGRFARREFLNEQDAESLCQWVASRPAPERTGVARTIKALRLPRNPEYCRASFRQPEVNVSCTTRYNRITHLAVYLRWLAIRVIEQSDRQVQRSDAAQIDAMVARLKSRRPLKRETGLLQARRGLDDVQQSTLLDLIRPGAPENPFKSQVQNRNALIVSILFHLGIRAGELLALRVDDVDLQANTLLVARRHGDIVDPRDRQPVAKTLDRRIPLSAALASQIASYILQGRRIVPGAKRHPFLFITHHAGPFVGAPLSMQGLMKVFRALQQAKPSAFGTLTAHVLRHTANDRFSAMMDRNKVPAATEEKMRSYLMGWKEGSGTAAIYTRRHVETSAHKAALDLQQTPSIVPGPVP